MTPVPVDSKRLDWPRLVANAINGLIARVERPAFGDVRYNGTTLQHWDGTDWVDVP